jgi:hypothetical protein
MGKKAKEHRRKVQARNSQSSAKRRAVMNFLQKNNLTPEEAMQKFTTGEFRPTDEQVFGPKETILKSPQHSIALPGTLGDHQYPQSL